MKSELVIRGVRYAFEDIGSGPLVLFGHGLYFDRSMFRDQARILSAQYRCVCLDWPGHGDSGWRDGGWGVGDLVDDVVELIAALGADNAILVGLSQGGAVFARVALAHPQRVRALVVMDATPFSPPDDLRERMLQNSRILASGDAEAIDGFLASVCRRIFSEDTRRSRPQVIGAAMQVFKRHDLAGLALAARVGLSYECIRERLGHLRVPTLLMWGKSDTASPIAFAEIYRARIPDLAYVEIECAGHSAPLEQPTQVSEALAQFLARLKPATASRSLAPRQVSPSMFAHFVVQTPNYDAMKRWYCTVLAARIVHEGSDLCFLAYDDEHHRLAIKRDPALVPPVKGAWGMHHLAYTYASLADLLSTYLRLRGEGILPYWTINHGPTTSMYYRDPDGTQIELQIDNFPDKDCASQYFLSRDFEANPIGVVFDAEQLVRAYKAGVPQSELLRRPPLPPGKSLNDMRPAA